jgi:exonuclease SbcC
VRDTLSLKSKALDDKTAEMTTRKSDREKSLLTEQSKMLTDQPLEVLKEELNETDAKISTIKERIGAINQKLKDNEIAKNEQGEKIKKLEQQRVISKKWEALNGLIGQKDGAKYSRFAQGITFEIMVSHANKQLIKLTDRYLLTRDTNEPLDLNIIDNYQAGECRSTKNLSGGESFIISLALALGLSGMSSKNVRIDTLFLDEGFGTLDEETLEIALDALSSLHQEGKLIGVISHVGSLKERINAKIEVVKGNGGISTLSGPGCSLINPGKI